MISERLFTPLSFELLSWQSSLLAILVVLFIATTVRIRRQTKGQVPDTYNVYAAWLRGFQYFCASVGLGLILGVVEKIIISFSNTTSEIKNPAWIGFTLACILVEIIAYYIIWPMGTLHHGRKLHIPSVVVFALLWGISDGFIFLSIWALVEFFVSIRWLIAVISFILIATYKGIWQSQYWDIHVSPEHNIPEWNLRKVLFAHIPNLLVTLTYLSIYESAGMFLIFQIIAIMGSAYFMRFPAWTTITIKGNQKIQ
ncbi:MAG: hypothetical protein GY755_02400 [Chloroflexi bacterium]|nr:hypothetical protein [Chloroflexota bacterium]